MSTETACILFSVPAIGYCALTLKKRWIAGPWGTKIKREEDPFFYWLIWTSTSAVALGLAVLPILTWTGVRE
jgi:hypothetical protein